MGVVKNSWYGEILARRVRDEAFTRGYVILCHNLRKNASPLGPRNDRRVLTTNSGQGWLGVKTLNRSIPIQNRSIPTENKFIFAKNRLTFAKNKSILSHMKLTFAKNKSILSHIKLTLLYGTPPLREFRDAPNN